MPLSSLLSFSTDFIPPTFTLYIAAFLWCRFGKETDSRQSSSCLKKQLKNDAIQPRMSDVKQAALVTLYCTVCGNHSIIEEKTQHLLNHRFPKFSDEKCITAYLWGKKAADKRYNSSRKSYYDWQSLFAELVFFLLRKYLCSRKLPFLTGLLQNDVSESANRRKCIWSSGIPPLLELSSILCQLLRI